MPANGAGHEVSALMAERDRLINALQELDFDYALGKIPEEDYPAQRAVLLQQGAEVLRELDRLTGEIVTGAPGQAAGSAQTGDDAEDRLEAVVAARRADARKAARPVPAAAAAGGDSFASRPLRAAGDDNIEQILAARRRERQERSGGFCSQCGGAVQKSDRFCPKCGSTLD